MSLGDKLRLAILGSGKGSNLEAIFRAIEEQKLDAEVKLVISDVCGAGILEIGRAYGARSEYIDPGPSRARLEPGAEQKIVELLRHAGAELVLLAGFMRIVGTGLLAAFPRRIINIHPSLLPKHPGLRAWEQALLAGDKRTGCTVHYVDEGVDTGEIVAQAEVEVLPGDTAESLHARIQQAEHKLYPEVVASLARARPFAV